MIVARHPDMLEIYGATRKRFIVINIKWSPTLDSRNRTKELARFDPLLMLPTPPIEPRLAAIRFGRQRPANRVDIHTCVATASRADECLLGHCPDASNLSTRCS